MADLSITPANVEAGTDNPAIVDGNAGEAFDAGDVVYLDATSQTWFKALNDTEAHAAARGLALGTAEAAGQRVGIQQRRSITVGSASIVVGEVYVVSSTAGKMCPASDLTTAQWVTIVGVGESATTIYLCPTITEIQYGY